MLRDIEKMLEQDEIQMDLIKDLKKFQDENVEADDINMKSRDFAWFKKFL